ncbi:MAG TPA: hypothetical protein VF767_12530, partial [Bryobacteraceae bacterium]
MIRRARRRYLQNLLVRQSVRAASVAMGGLILLLVAGTQLLDWRMVTLLVVLSIAAGFRTFGREIPSRYLTAQRIDRRLDLEDALSTALYFESAAKARASESMREAQRAQAEGLAVQVDVVRAIPFTLPRSIYAMAALGLVASSLFALRYGVMRTLDLRPPLAALLFDAFPFASQPETAAKKKREVRRADDRFKPAGIPLEQETARPPGEQGSAPGFSTEESAADASKGEAGADASRQQGSASTEALNRRTPGTDKGQGPGEGKEDSSEGDSSSSRKDTSQGDPSGPSARSQADPGSHESNGLLDKFREAMNNLMSRLKSQPRQGDSQSMGSQAQKSDSERSRREGAQNSSRQSGRQSDGSPNGDSQGNEQGEGDQQAQNGPGKQGGREAQDAARQGQTGIGKSDGSKDIRQAEQLAAMGK